jgi:hypothetical protein
MFEPEVITDLPEKVYTQEDARLFVAEAELCNLITPWYNAEGVSLEFDNPVELFDGNMGRIGFATLYKEGTKLMAYLFFRYDCPERLDIDAGEHLFVKPLGEAILENVTDLGDAGISRVLNGGPLALYHLSIRGVQFVDRPAFLDQKPIRPRG